MSTVQNSSIIVQDDTCDLYSKEIAQIQDNGPLNSHRIGGAPEGPE